MQRLQVLMVMMVGALISLAASAGSLDLYSRPGKYLVKGSLEVDRSGLSLVVFKTSSNAIRLHLKFVMPPEKTSNFIWSALADRDVQVGLTGEIREPMRLQQGILYVTSEKIEASPPDLLRSSRGDGFWLLK